MYNISTLKDVLRTIEPEYKNVYFSIFEVYESDSIKVCGDFYVGSSVWENDIEVTRYKLINENRIEVIQKTLNKLLEQKETTRICVKFWTGVEIE